MVGVRWFHTNCKGVSSSRTKLESYWFLDANQEHAVPQTDTHTHTHLHKDLKEEQQGSKSNPMVTCLKQEASLYEKSADTETQMAQRLVLCWYSL